MSFYPLVQLRRAASQHSFNRPVFSCSVHVTEGIAEILEQCEYLREINGSDIDGNSVNFNDYIDQEIELTFRTPRTNESQFYQNLNAFLDNFTFSYSEDVELPEFYLFDEDLYYSSNSIESDDDDIFSRLKLLIRSVAKLENLAHYHDEKMGDSRTLVYLSGEHRTPIVLSVSISENLLSKDINFSLLNELTSAESELNMHYSDKLSVFYASLHEFLGGGYAPDEAFNKLIDSWGAFVALYQNNLSTYLSGFSFHKAKKEVAEAEIELSEKLTNLTSDIVFKLFSVPASVMALAAIMQKGQLDALVFVLLVIGVIVTILLMYGLLKSQKNKYESLEKAKDLVFSSIDGKEAEYPDELNTEITAMKSRLNKHFKSTGKWLGYYKVAIFSPLIALILFIIIA
ncbi:hypothetical protein IX95_12830 [Vibrio sp. B183]|uniref:hypothetical protein n=1 Tax=Vibrio sp. B183 TaxID=1526762 RepID=UPI0005007344|nr:hypothetical protein [Vibrio sp. B183]KFI11540.1 hypothetical protein IX95_12830 [Vibrio sp. B183]